MARGMHSHRCMKHGLLVVLGAGVLALDYLVYRAQRLSGANMNLSITLREPVR